MFLYSIADHPLRSVLLGIIAAGLAWQLNKLPGRFGRPVPLLLPPLAEEAAKTIPAVFFGADIFIIHLVFGAVEGGWEILATGRGGIFPGLGALACHAVFGAATASVYHLHGALLPALAAGCLLHAAWNYTVLKYLPLRKKGTG